MLLAASDTLKTSVCNSWIWPFLVTPSLHIFFPQQLEWPVVLHNHSVISTPWSSASAASSCLQFPLLYWITLAQPSKFSSGTPFLLEASGPAPTLGQMLLFCVTQYRVYFAVFLLVCRWACLPSSQILGSRHSVTHLCSPGVQHSGHSDWQAAGTQILLKWMNVRMKSMSFYLKKRFHIEALHD